MDRTSWSAHSFGCMEIGPQVSSLVSIFTPLFSVYPNVKQSQRAEHQRLASPSLSINLPELHASPEPAGTQTQMSSSRVGSLVFSVVMV